MAIWSIAVKDKAEQAIRQFDMLTQGDRVVVGLSGGADSVALLHFLCTLREAMGLQVEACHLNHCLRGVESQRDAVFCQELCQRLGVKLYSFTEEIVPLAARTGQSVELAARRERYRLFFQVAGADKVATAHTLSDNIETVLFSLARGTGPMGLCGIPPVRGQVIRPLILATRRQVEAYCAAHGLSYVQDSTNARQDYTRNFIRHAVVPLFYRLNPSFDQAFSRLLCLQAADQALLEGQAAAALAQAGLPAGGYRLAPLAALPPALLGRALRQWLVRAGAPYDYRRISQCCRAVRQGAGQVDLGGGFSLVAGQGSVRLAAPPPPPAEPVAVGVGALRRTGGVRIPRPGGKVLQLCLHKPGEYEYSKNICQKQLKNALDYAKIEGSMVFRARRPGDLFVPPGRGVCKTVKKLMIEQKIPREQRGSLSVAETGGRVCWVEGLGVSAPFLPGPDTQLCLCISVVEEKGDDPGYTKGVVHPAADCRGCAGAGPAHQPGLPGQEGADGGGAQGGGGVFRRPDPRGGPAGGD